MKAIRYKNRAELFVLNGNKRPIRYEFHNGVKPNRYNGNVVQTENILQLLTGLQFDICYIIKTRVGFKIAEMTRFLNYNGSYSFALQNNLKILENSREYVYSEVIFL